MAILRAGQTALLNSARTVARSPSLLASTALRRQILGENTGYCRHGYASSTTTTSTIGAQKQGPSAALAFAIGSVLSGALGYYLATSAGSADRAGAEFNTQYGSPEDFRRAIEELKVALPDDDAVSTDEEDLERHGNSGFAYHASQSRTRRPCLQLILKHSGDVSRR